MPYNVYPSLSPLSLSLIQTTHTTHFWAQARKHRLGSEQVKECKKKKRIAPAVGEKYVATTTTALLCFGYFMSQRLGRDGIPLSCCHRERALTFGEGLVRGNLKQILYHG